MQKHSRYFYTRLPEGQKLIYDNILQSLYNYQKDIKIISPFAINTVLKINDCVLFDNPELFYVNSDEIPYSYNSGHAVINFNFLYNMAEINNITRNIQGKTQILMQKLYDKNYNDFDKEKEIHDFLARNVEYDNTQDTDPVFHNIVGALLNGTAVCSGYSKAFKYLCDLANMSAVYVSGEAINPAGILESHAWNIIKINNDCYHVDVTWNSCQSITKDTVCYNYFNISDAYMKTDHIWDMQNYPRCNLTSDIIPYITSGSDFKNYIITQVKNKNRNFSMRVNKKFNDDKEVLGRISGILAGSWIFGKTITVRYNKNQDIINVSLKPT